MRIFCLFLFKEIKDGEVVGDDLEELSKEVGTSWKALARCFKFGEAEIDGFDHVFKELRDKCYGMLCTWKRREGSKATYNVVYKALCHKYVECNGLAEKYCILESADKEESTSEVRRLKVRQRLLCSPKSIL